MYRVIFERGTVYYIKAKSKKEAYKIAKERHPECEFWDLLRIEKI